MESIEENKLIAEFMGATRYYLDGNVFTFPMMENPEQSQNRTTTHRIEDIKYHSSWDWLHQAFDKFKTIQLKEWAGDGIKWNHKFSFHLEQVGSAIVHNPIAEAFQRLVIAIQWFNSSNTKQK